MEIREHEVTIVVYKFDENGHIVNDVFNMIIKYEVIYFKGYKQALDVRNFVKYFNEKYKAKISISNVSVNNLVEKPYIEEIFVEKENSKVLYRLLKLEQLNASCK